MGVLWGGVGVYCLLLEVDLTAAPIGTRDFTIPRAGLSASTLYKFCIGPLSTILGIPPCIRP